MIRVHIKTSEGVETNYKDFDSQELADAYIAEVTASAHWGEGATFESEDITAQKALDDRISGLQASGLEDAEVCQKCLAVVGGYNKEKALTPEQIQAVISQFSTINFLLNNNMPRTAKAAISGLVTDSYSEELKALLLEVLKEF